ncbi:protein of unknown function DUF488 [Ancylobacter novellus DSM 506]|uniref:DUF488 domain-containing protein n=1 Tax=Ancylobacter novellus (strain ATCC 8093 / DSM 506 / JCM 20403 / CCM 1077 / IAM 12100 / NBRC 12443 / NCIMB 10456) TaxID=639283 RepID=D7A8E8_ANCN5|nr:protein of unknown function DUF488 [Ancylobacter novellus DSM 506]
MTSSEPDLLMKRAYEPARPDDGARVLVDRLWPRGVRKDDLKLTLWLKDIAPSTELREWFGHDPARFKEFARRYREELRANEGALAPLEQLLGSGRATLIYAARDADHNEAVVLADYLRERFRTG